MYAAAVTSAICLALIVPLFTTLLVELLAPWPKPREHHDYLCAECQCSYAGPAELARHVTAQHLDAGARALETWDRAVVELNIRQEVP